VLPGGLILAALLFLYLRSKNNVQNATAAPIVVNAGGGGASSNPGVVVFAGNGENSSSGGVGGALATPVNLLTGVIAAVKSIVSGIEAVYNWISGSSNDTTPNPDQGGTFTTARNGGANNDNGNDFSQSGNFAGPAAFAGNADSADSSTDFAPDAQLNDTPDEFGGEALDLGSTTFGSAVYDASHSDREFANDAAAGFQVVANEESAYSNDASNSGGDNLGTDGGEE